MKAKKLSKVILSFALSAALLAEPVAGMPVVCAEEIQTTDQFTEGEKSDDNTTGNQEGSAGKDDKENSDDPDKKDDETDDPRKEDENGEKDEETGGSTEGESGDTIGEEDSGEETEDFSEAEDDKTVSGNDIDEASEKSDLDGFSDMPSGYKLTSFQKEMKADMLNALSQLDESDEGATYAEGQVYTFASSQEEAEMIAEAYHAEIVNYSMGVLTLKLSKNKTVRSALKVASDMNNSLPAVWPNYQRELYGEVVPDVTESAILGLEVEEEEYSADEVPLQDLEDGIPSQETYEQALSELSGGYDPFLSTDSKFYQWFHNTIGSPYAWDAGYQGQGVTVGVVDSGIDTNSDLAGNVTGGYNFCDNNTNTVDSLGHGTHVAGIIAALKDGNKGTGVAPQAKIYNAKVFGNDENRSGYDSTILAAVNYLIGEEGNTGSEKIDAGVSARVDIINMSLGGPGFTTPYKVVLDKAYMKGVIVFAATGNDGGSLKMVPAACDHVIGVAATDNNNQRAYFSNYGSTTDLAAPGVNIWATYGSDYDSLQGTSMACPVAAGEAAIILSGQDALPALKGKTGKDRVNAVESIMKSNTISAGSGMGKGITSLTKVFKLSTAAVKPNAPTISFADTSNNTAQSMDITIRVQAGMKICYTRNGKNPVFKNGEAGTGTTLIESNTTTISVSGADAAKGTVKAIAVNASGAASAVKSYTYTLKPYVKNITIAGPVRVEKGKSIQLTAAVTPTYATNKGVTWALTTANDGDEVDSTQIKIDQKGKITTTAKAEVGTKYTVTVTAKDGSGIAIAHPVEIVEANTAIQKIAFGKNVKKELWLGAKTREDAVSLFDYVTAEEKDDTGKKNRPITDREVLKKHLLWTSSKPAVAEVDSSTGIVTAKAVGTTTITVKTDDNLAKKATVNITVKQAVTGITITKGDPLNQRFTVAPGKSIALKANLEPGRPTNNKVNWSIAPDIDADNTASAADMKNITINKTNGKITTKANVVPGSYVVTAEAADGKGATATKKVTVVAGAIGGIKLDKTKVTLSTTDVDGGVTDATITATITGVKGRDGKVGDFDPHAYNITSSNASVVTATAAPSTKGEVEITLKAVGTKYGKANITIASTDGSNKKATCAVTVSGGINKVEIVDTQGGTKKVSKLTLFRGNTVNTVLSTATLYAKITGSSGANKTAYEVTSNSPLVKIVGFDADTGKIDFEASKIATGKATITVMATDGSKKKATCTVTVINPISNINIAPKAGATRYVVPGKSVQLTATIETEYGAVSNKKVKWSLNGGGGIVSVNASGKVSVDKRIKLDNICYADVIATAQDGSGVTATYRVYLTTSTTKVLLSWNQSNKGKIAGMYPNRVYIYTFTSDCTSPMTCATSSADVASPTISYRPAYYDGNGQLVEGFGYIKFVTTKKGKATLTVKALDSTGKSDSMVILVQ